jgi:hypothetical protein
MASSEKHSLLAAQQLDDKSNLPDDNDFDDVDLEQATAPQRRSSILRTLHTVYSIAVTFVLAVVAAQALLKSWSKDRSFPRRENPFPDSMIAHSDPDEGYHRC